MGKGTFFLITVSLFLFRCEDSAIKKDCYHGQTIMSSCCTGTTFIEIDPLFPIGKATELNGQHYQNVIQVPGYLDAGEIYLNLREFDPDHDQSLYPTPICYCLIGVGMDVPVWVATKNSSITYPISEIE